MIPISEKVIGKLIAKGKAMIERHNVIFFDVFDTLLARDCSEPSDVFQIVEDRYNSSGAGTPIAGFREMRRAAEIECSKHIRAPNIDQIYSYLPVNDREKEALKALELDTELSISTKKYTGYALYKRAVELNKKIVAVSDMYLGAGIIGKMLSNAGYSVDSVIVSCEYGAEKYDGRLFGIAINKVGADKKDIVHFGDNPVSDIIGAVRAGISSLWIPARKNLTYFKKCGDFFSDHYLLPFVANRAALLENRVEALGYETCGPMIVGFCQWLHRQIHEGGYNKALFSARDLRQTYEIYLQMYPEDRELVQYFYVSRKSLLPAFEAVSEKNTDSEAQKQLLYLREYMRQSGCVGKVALVDSGLQGRSQKMLDEISDGSYELHGIYMRISRAFYDNIRDNQTKIYMYPDKPDMRHNISSMFFETMVAATHGRTVSYEKQPSGEIKPRLGDEHPDPTKIHEFQKGAYSFADDYLGSVFGREAISERAVRDLMLRFAFYPKKEDVLLLGDVLCGNEKYEQLMIHRKWHYCILHPIGTFVDLKNTYWKGGYLKQAFGALSPLICKAYVSLDCFILNRIGRWKNEREPD